MKNPWDDGEAPWDNWDNPTGGNDGNGGGGSGGGNPDDGLVDCQWNEFGAPVPYNFRVTPAEYARRKGLYEASIAESKNDMANPQPDQGGGNDQTPGSRPQYNFKPVPEFDAPEFKWDQTFTMPTEADMKNDPGYRFRLSQGEDALQASAAARGVLRTGGTLKDIIGYGQNFASQEYGNVFDRALSTYGTNYNTARDVFDRKYQGAKDEYAPKLFEWQTLTSAEQNAANMGWEQLWKKWYNDHLSAADVFNAGNA